MEEREVVDVLICGAGAAGLTLAIDLARRGVSLRLIDRLPGPFVGSSFRPSCFSSAVKMLSTPGSSDGGESAGANRIVMLNTSVLPV